MSQPGISVACLLVLLGTSACRQTESAQSVAASSPSSDEASAFASPRLVTISGTTPAATASDAARDTAMFAGGCFWSMERPFQHVPGVTATVSGYAGGHTSNPTYEDVSSGTTGYAETVLVEYHPAKVTYEKLLDVYWHNIDPITKDRQFCDGGTDYRTVIFTHGAAEHEAALRSRAALDRSGHFKVPVVTEVVADAPFWRAEEYHQHYADRNPVRYELYRRACGRDARLRELWGAAAAPYVPGH